MELCEKKMREEIAWFVKKELWFNDSGEVTSIAYIDEDDNEALVFRKYEKTWQVCLEGCDDLTPDNLLILGDMLNLLNRKEDLDDSKEEYNG